MKIYILMALMCAGCTFEGRVSEEDENKLLVCTDTRDGEVFSFNTNTITNIRIGIGVPNSYDMVTTEGEHMTLKSGVELYLKCKEAP